MTNAPRLGSSELLYNCAARMGLRPTWMRPRALLAIATPQGERYLCGATGSLNSQISRTLARNKLYARMVLERHLLPNIAYLKPTDLASAEQFLATHAKIIVKPLKGTNSRDVHIVDSPTQLTGMNVSDYILEKYIAGKELRYLVLNDEVIAVHESQYGTSVAETRDLKRVSYPQSAWDTGLVSLSLQAASALGLRYAAVDFLIDSQGRAHILEVNSSPGMKWFHAPTSGPAVDLARLYLEATLDDIDSSSLADPLATYPAVAYT